MEILLACLLYGTSYAFILFLLSSGLSLIFGVMGILNLAHGSLYLLGAYFGVSAARQWNNFYLGILLSAVGVAIIGLLLERLCLKRLHNKLNEQALLTLGIVYVVANLVLWIWGPFSKMGSTPDFLKGVIGIAGFNFSIYRLAIIIIGIVIYVGLWLLQDKTRIGSVVRAGMDDKQMTIGLGVNYGLVSTSIFIVGSIMGGIAGFLGSPIVGLFPEMSMQILLLAMIVVVVGGIGKVQGALVGSLVIAYIDTFGKSYFPDFAMFTVYLIFIIMLLVKPTGLLGRKKT